MRLEENGMKKFLVLLLLLTMFVGFAQCCSAIGCKLLITEDTAFSDKWYKVPANSGLSISVTSQVYPKQFFTIYILLYDVGVNKAKEVKVYYDLEIIDSDGGVYHKSTDMEAINYRVSNPNILLLSKSGLLLRFGANDKLGSYTVKVKARDLVTNKVAYDESGLQLVEFKLENSFQDEQTFGEWLTYYYENPQAAKALSAYLYYAKSNLSENESARLPVIAFFRKVFTKNRWLLDHVINQYSKEDDKTRAYLLYLLKLTDYLPEEFITSLSKEEQEILDKLSQEQLPDPYGEIASPEQIDMLWGEFFAGGEYKTIKRIVDLLELSKYKGSLEKYAKSQKSNKDDEEKAYLDVIYCSLKWSLASNCVQHKLVHDYCNLIYHNEKLPKLVKKELKEILDGLKK